MHDVQTDSRLGVPLTIARMRWMFGFQRRRVRRCEWLTAIPKLGCFPQTSHTAAMGVQGSRPGRPLRFVGMDAAVMDTVGPEQLRAAMVAYRDLLRASRERLNRLNVYPVPDGDTGTNMSLTL